MALKNWQIVALLAVAVLVFHAPTRDAVLGAIGMGGSTSGGATVTTTQTAPGAAAIPRCYIEDTTLTLGAAQEKYNPTYNIKTTEHIAHRLFKNGVHKGLYEDGSTVTVNPGDKVDIYWAENSTGSRRASPATGETGYGGYYTAKQSFTIPCAGEVTAGEQPDSDAYKIYAAANNFTVRFLNEDDGDVNTKANNESIANGDLVSSVTMKMIGTYEDAWSPFGDVVLVLSGNSSVYEDMQLACAGKPVEETTVPKFYQKEAQGKFAENEDWAFKIPGLISNEKDYDCSLVLDIEDSLVTGADDKLRNISATFYDSDWYYNTDTGVEEFGIEDNAGNDVGFKNYLKTLYVGAAWSS